LTILTDCIQVSFGPDELLLTGHTITLGLAMPLQLSHAHVLDATCTCTFVIAGKITEIWMFCADRARETTNQVEVA